MTSIAKYSHHLGLRHTGEYKCWKAMRARCASKTNNTYGGKGITVCERWSGIDGFENFILDMDWKPTPKHSIDRIDNNKGYYPENCRWATRSVQTYNRGRFKTNTSGYIGVVPDKRYVNKWYVNFWIDNVNYGLGMFNNPELAAIEYDKAVIFFRGDYGTTNIL